MKALGLATDPVGLQDMHGGAIMIGHRDRGNHLARGLLPTEWATSRARRPARFMMGLRWLTMSKFTPLSAWTLPKDLATLRAERTISPAPRAGIDDGALTGRPS